MPPHSHRQPAIALIRLALDGFQPPWQRPQRADKGKADHDRQDEVERPLDEHPDKPGSGSSLVNVRHAAEAE